MNFFTTGFTALCTAVGNVFSWLAKRSDLKNTSVMQVAKQNQSEADAQSKTATVIANRNTKEIENELAE
jgi:hypothetical protein